MSSARPADFPILMPRDQKLAGGTDGVFAASDLWTLTSPTVDFLGQGLAPGQVVQLTRPVTYFKPPGECFVIVSVSSFAATLRRKGQPPGVGQPPAPSGGLAGVEYLVTTLGPQIALAGYDLNRRYGIDDLIAGRRTCDLYDPREIRDAAVLSVLFRQYSDMSRYVEDKPDVFAMKAQAVKQELGELLDRVVIHWRPATAPPSAGCGTSRLSTRISR